MEHLFVWEDLLEFRLGAFSFFDFPVFLSTVDLHGAPVSSFLIGLGFFFVVFSFGNTPTKNWMN